ncbi:MAG: hypothetical protein WC326_02535 [Candidatus Delongbacteria bacterium]
MDFLEWLSNRQWRSDPLMDRVPVFGLNSASPLTVGAFPCADGQYARAEAEELDLIGEVIGAPSRLLCPSLFFGPAFFSAKRKRESQRAEAEDLDLIGEVIGAPSRLLCPSLFFGPAFFSAKRKRETWRVSAKTEAPAKDYRATTLARRAAGKSAGFSAAIRNPC